MTPRTAIASRPRNSRNSTVRANPMRPSASTRCSVSWAKSCNGPIRPIPRCRTGCATIPTWARATVPKSPKPSMTCCAICAATASSVKAAWVRPRAVWPSWA
ncbi:hypothetical protein G6F65_021687 [Rhizopus arrhizus]|nr:hypothetical protein G6F65_021687 [Rhizopus arrhizus]